MLMGPTDPVRNGPYRQMHNVILAGHDCDGCWKRTCRKNIDCLSAVKPEQALEKILKIEMIDCLSAIKPEQVLEKILKIEMFKHEK